MSCHPDPMEHSFVRPYSPRDEAAVRRICFETALYGQSMQPLLDDVDLVSEAFVGYYLQSEADNVLVAMDRGEVAGYLCACLDTERFERRFARRVAPRLLGRFLVRGYWLRFRIWCLFASGVRYALRWRATHDDVLRAYPAHVHLNIDAQHQRRGLGGRLLDEGLERMRRDGTPGVHISTDTEGGRHIFARAGFVLLKSYDIQSVRDGGPLTVSVMGRKLGGDA